jgi:signal transduction histidine kinase
MTMESPKPTFLTSLAFVKTASLAILFLGGLVLLGWLIKMRTLTNFWPELADVKANTALGFMLCGTALWLIRDGKASAKARLISKICALAVILLGILTSCEYAMGWDPGIDQLLAKDDLGKTLPGRPSVPTALNFTLLGTALLMLRFERRPKVAELLNLTAVMISLLALIGYACRFPPFYGGSVTYPDTLMGLPTVLAFLLLSAAMLCAHPERGLFAILKSDTDGSLVAKRLLLVPVVVPLILGVLQLLASRTASEHKEAASWLFAFSNIFVFTTIIWWNANLLHKNDLDRRTANEEIKAAYHQLESFSYSVSHDLRSPLRAIKGYAAFLKEDCEAQLTGDGKRYLDAVGAQTLRMERLIEDLLAFSKYTNRPVEKRRLELDALAQSVFEELSQETKGRQVEFKVGNLPACDADPALMKQVMLNLLSNAVKFTRKREVAKVEVGCRKSMDDGMRWTYFVQDNGAGFDMKYTEKLFGVFQRLHHQDDFEGTGVGLAVAQNIINRHGGKIWAEAAVEQGACFYFTLPKA